MVFTGRVDLSVRDVRCFALVARRLSFSRAAVELGMSQPAASQAIARLERAIGLRLLERSSREVRLSPAGRLLLPHAEALLERAGAFAVAAAELAVASGRTIRLAYCPLVGALAARIARRLGDRKPAMDIELRPVGWSGATAALAEGTASAAIMSTPFPPGLATTARFHVPITHLAVRTGAPLATAARIRPEQLTRYELLMPRNRPPGSVWAQLTARLAGARDAGDGFGGPRIVLEDIDDLPGALDLVAAGRGLLPTPQLLVETIRRPDVRFIPFDLGDLRMTYGLVWSAERGAGFGSASAETMALVQAVQEVLRIPSTAARGVGARFVG
jgi:DNA-binding transcriptional LysR family regulator